MKCIECGRVLVRDEMKWGGKCRCFDCGRKRQAEAVDAFHAPQLPMAVTLGDLVMQRDRERAGGRR